MYENGYAEGKDGQIVMELSFNAGKQTGDFRLDFASGVCQLEPDQFATPEGEVDIDRVFRRTYNGLRGGAPEKSVLDPVSGQYVSAYEPMNGLAVATTMDLEEEYRQRVAFLNETVVYEETGESYPISPGFDPINPRLTGDFNVTVKVDPNSGVETLGTDAAAPAPAEYFDLNGRKVSNPRGGVYLVKRGSAVTKEVIR